MESVFVKVDPKERLPSKYGLYIVSHNNGMKFQHELFDSKSSIDFWHNFDYWLEEVHLPTDKELEKESDKGWVRSHFKAGANFILDHIKKGIKK